ncbi:hypothetical protein MBLNU13_g04270t1 [Cladosporium sp. NU13]
MECNEDTRPHSAAKADRSQEQSRATEKSTPSDSQNQSPSPLSGTAQSSTPSLLSYDAPPNLTPKYNDAGIYATRPNPSTSTQQTKPHPQPNPRNQPISAASLNAVMATSSSSTDKMHSQPLSSRKVDNWNEDPTYKSRLASMVGSTRKWNYFGADIGGNPFRRSKK